jgi:hypothetical protein
MSILKLCPLKISASSCASAVTGELRTVVKSSLGDLLKSTFSRRNASLLAENFLDQADFRFRG